MIMMFIYGSISCIYNNQANGMFIRKKLLSGSFLTNIYANKTSPVAIIYDSKDIKKAGIMLYIMPALY